MQANRHQRRWYQFGLRTLLIVFTLICVTCGVTFGIWIKKSRRHSAVLEIEKEDGKIYYASVPTEESRLYRTLGRFVPKDWLYDIDRVDYYYWDDWPTDKEMAALGTITEVQQVSLNGLGYSRGDLIHLKKLTRLRELWVNCSQVSDEAIAELQKALPNCTIHHDSR